MNHHKNILRVALISFLIFLVSSCQSSSSTNVVSFTPTSTLIITEVTITSSTVWTPTFNSTPMSSPASQISLCDFESLDPQGVLLNDEVYFSIGPIPKEIDDRLSQIYPQWEDFDQIVTTDPWTAGVVLDQASFGGPEYGVNPAVLLVTVGMNLEWQVPSDGDLYNRAVQTAKELEQYAVDYYTQEEIKSAYPQIGNQSTYALYQYFGEDLDLLEKWCRTYQAFFGDKYPLKP